MTKRIIAQKQVSQPGPGRVPAAVAAELLALVAAHEGDPLRFLRGAGMGHMAYLLGGAEVLAQGPAPGLASGTITRGDFARLYAHATAALDTRAAHQEGRESLTKAGLDMMCHALITCRTLRDAIARMTRFSTLLAPRTAELTLEVAGGEARLTMATLRQVRNSCAYLSDLTGLSSYHRLLGWLAGEDIPLSGVGLRYPPLLGPRLVGYLMPHPIRHHAMENCLRFPAAYLDRPVVRSPHELDRMLANFPFDIAEPQSKESPLSERIGNLYAAQLASGEALSTTGQLARQFSISAATLKRRLLAEGTGLARIKAAARRDLAETLLADPRLSVAEIGRRTRFSDVTAFRRAFRQWSGQSPSAWRQGLGGTPAVATG